MSDQTTALPSLHEYQAITTGNVVTSCCHVAANGDTEQEVKGLLRCRKLGITTPAVLCVDLGGCCLALSKVMHTAPCPQCIDHDTMCMRTMCTVPLF